MSISIPSPVVSSSIASANKGVEQAIERISSAQRINSAADDAAGLAISSRIDSDLRGYNQALRNTGDGISLANTTDGALGSISESVQRIRELALQSANGTLTDSDRRAIDSEAQELKDEVARVVETTQFNGQSLLNDDRQINLQTGPNAEDQVSVNIANFARKLEESGFFNIDLSSQQGATNSLEPLDSLQDDVNAQRAELGANINRLDSLSNQLEESRINSAEANSRIRDADIAKEVADKTRNDILLQSSIFAQKSRNQQGESVLRLLS